MSTQENRTPWSDIALTALAPLIWGSTYIVTTEFLPVGRPFTAALLRTLPAGILLTLLSKRLPEKHIWGRLLVLSALNIACFQALLFVAAYRLPGGLAAVVGAIQPLLVMGGSWAMDGRRPARLATLASILGVAGMAALLLSPGSTWDAIGIAAALAGAASMAAGTYLAKRWQSDVPVLAFTGWQLLTGAVMLIPVAWLLDPPLPSLGATAFIAYAYLSLVGAAFAYALWFREIAKLSSVAVSSLGLLSPLIAVILGWIFLGQILTGTALAGLGSVLASVLMVQLASKPHNTGACLDVMPARSLRQTLHSPSPQHKEKPMNDTMKTLIEARISVNHYDTTRDISDEQVAELVRLSTLAPSAYNF